jgi:hypothetical protein
MRVTQPFDLAQGHESFDLAQDRELVERLVERLVEWQMGVFRQPLKHLFHKKEDNRATVSEFESQAHHISHKRPPGRLKRFSPFFSG